METNPYEAPAAEIRNTSPQIEGYDDNSMYTFRGRFNRTNYFLSIGLLWLIMAIISTFLAKLIGYDPYDPNQVFSTGYWIVTGVSFLVVPLYIIWTIKRFHDMDYSGWMTLLLIIPLVNLVMMFILLLAKGNQTSNRFGPPQAPNPSNAKFYVIALAVINLCFFGYQMAKAWANISAY